MQIGLKIIVLSLLLVFCFSCKKEKPQEEPTNLTGSTGLSSSTKRYIKFTLGGINYNVTEPTNAAWAAGSRSMQTNAGHNYYKTWDTYQPSPGFNLCVADTAPVASIPVSDAWYKQFLTVKNYSYSPLNLYQNYTYETGIYMDTKDNSSVFWHTVNPIKPSYQNGSAFQITEKVEYTSSGKLNIIFKAIFNCKMYNNSGDSLALTNGEMIVSFSNY